MAVKNLPVINISKECSNYGAENWSSTCSNMRKALEEYGCFMIVVKDGIKIPDSEMHDSIFALSEQVFDLPLEIKEKNTSTISFFGYHKDVPEMPLRESMGLGDATSLEEANKFCNLMWPDRANDSRVATFHEYANQLASLEKLMRRMVFESYGIGREACESHLDSSVFLLGLSTYRVPEPEETNVAAVPHTDKTFFTILDQNEVGGLEVKLKDSEEWIAVDFQPSSVVVMAGEGLVAWSNNRIIAPVHQVIMSGKVKRYSTGMFSFHKGIMDTPEELIDEEHPRLFRPFNHIGLLDFYGVRFRNGQISADGALQAYCGV